MLAHPYFADVDVKALEAKAVKPPFIPNFGKKSLKEFFNVADDKAALTDTYIPRENEKIVKKMDREFENKFASKNVKKK